MTAAEPKISGKIKRLAIAANIPRVAYLLGVAAREARGGGEE
jgi:hypothetical protein